MRLKTFVHVSDLHFGQVDLSTLDAKTRRLWKMMPKGDGLLGHSRQSMERLDKFFHRLVRTEQAELIVTGDMTSAGHPDQFSLGEDFLGDTLGGPRWNYVGLQAKGWKERGVPGNHDHWPGHAVIFGRGTEFRRHLSATPFETLIPLQGGRRLRIVGIDTDMDVSPYLWNRFLAKGSFRSELGPAAGLLGPNPDGEIRVLLLHHSLAYKSSALKMRALEIKESSKHALHKFIVQHDIAVLLSGHTHVPAIVPFAATSGKQQQGALEATCGTTTQKTDALLDWPAEWREIALRGALPRTNTLLVHRLLEEDQRIVWHVETYVLAPNGFEKAPPAAGKLLLEHRMTVWPRP